ncbi:hypothetical protein FHS43_002908 [Streptosporangium becharense]|uniref:Glycosyltransferase RgtA/B/C/D-like domain-containing protein n=1 Tax=Streptosporangium becharense TaxID=1816182 RepID=A0A7W9IKU9_9ACTN|nr:hypothetical protein [Streptosporangium becharense]MBB2911635.1 hypothetical protein [Streptosporangium becharense]MBB5822547.1 hypothetical protein [Streptosporangium becharense]
MEYVVVAVSALILILLVHASFETRLTWRVLPVLVLAFAARLVVHVLLLRGGVIDYGGDNFAYELRALEIVAYWRSEGFGFVTAEEIPSLYSAAGPCHVFALVVYLCGGPAPLACAAVVALLACGLCTVLYKFARLVGADERSALRLLVFTAFLPTLLVHTSDTFKDGFNAFLVLICLWLAASNAQRFDVRKVLALVPLLWALWYVRPYMVFMCALPLLFGVIKPNRAVSLRLVVFSLVLLTAAAVQLDDTLSSGPIATMQEELERGQASNVRVSNAEGESGVLFDDGGNPWSRLGPKILYTLLSPFPWTPGSTTLQLGKIEVLLLYFLFYWAVVGARRLWRHDRRMLLLLLLFIVPSTVAYATTMANIGLIFRQRIPIVLVVSLLAAVGWTGARRGARRFAGQPAVTAPGTPAPGTPAPGTPVTAPAAAAP